MTEGLAKLTSCHSHPSQLQGIRDKGFAGSHVTEEDSIRFFERMRSGGRRGRGANNPGMTVAGRRWVRSGGVWLTEFRKKLQHEHHTVQGTCPDVHTRSWIRKPLAWSIGSTPVLVVLTSNLLCGEPCQC